MKVFLSHSSKDKEPYVRIVSNKLGPENCHYDEWTFETGMKTLDEIQKGLNTTDLFVLFLSDASLNSEWVQQEMINADQLHHEGMIEQIFPIIIDNSITYKDHRIPHWMHSQYNLKPITRPTVAARRIQKRMREISWNYHPKIKEREKIFVGRNDLIRKFEERIDSVDLPTPVCIIASGIQSIGRRSLLKNSLIKGNIVGESYKPAIINLSRRESIEDFILKVYDLGFSQNIDTTNLLTKNIDEKITIANQLLNELQGVEEVLQIVDDRCLITHDARINQWFSKLLKNISDMRKVTLLIASSIRPRRDHIRNAEHIFALEVPELDRIERVGLLKRYAQFENLDLIEDDLKFFGGLLQGYPEQIFHAVNLINDIGLSKAKKDSYLVVEFNSEKVWKLMSEYESNEQVLDFLRLLADFDFISYELIFKIVDQQNNFYQKLLDKLLSSAICEYLGANGEYIRLNDTIRDYIKRNRFSLSEKYKKRLINHVKEFLEHYEPEDYDVSDFLYSAKSALLEGDEIDEKYLIPSHFLQSMKDLYDVHKKYKEVISLADRTLQNKENIDEDLLKEIRYYLCLSLARERDNRFLREVQEIHGPEHHFLFGFFYRLTGQFNKSLDSLRNSLSERKNFQRAKRELVQVYLLIEEYDRAKELARQNYEADRLNPYHVQAYFNCLINGQWSSTEKEVMQDLIKRLNAIDTETSKEMYFNALAKFTAICEDNEELALNYIDSSISLYKNRIYPLLTKFDICKHFSRLDDMKSVIADLEKITNNESYFRPTTIKNKAIYFAINDQVEEAYDLIETKLNNYPEQSKQKLILQIKRLESKTTL